MIDPIERRKWVDSLINIDILELKPKTTAMIDYIISKSNARVQTLSIAGVYDIFISSWNRLSD